jgi:hypothetical protein
MAASSSAAKPNELDPDPSSLSNSVCAAPEPNAALVPEMDGRGRPGEMNAAPQSFVAKSVNDGARQKPKKPKKKNKKKLGLKGADSGTAPSASSSNRDSDEDDSSDLDEDYSDDEDEGTEGYKKGQT